MKGWILTPLRTRIASPAVELGSAVAAIILTAPVAALLIAAGDFHPHKNNAAAFFDSVFLGPSLVLAGAWLHTRRGQGLGVLMLGLGLLLTLDGVVATYFVGLPLLLLVSLSFASALSRRTRERPQEQGDPSSCR